VAASQKTSPKPQECYVLTLWNGLDSSSLMASVPDYNVVREGVSHTVEQYKCSSVCFPHLVYQFCQTMAYSSSVHKKFKF
jgi:hypothetical protein